MENAPSPDVAAGSRSIIPFPFSFPLPLRVSVPNATTSFALCLTSADPTPTPVDLVPISLNPISNLRLLALVIFPSRCPHEILPPFQARQYHNTTQFRTLHCTSHYAPQHMYTCLDYLVPEHRTLLPSKPLAYRLLPVAPFSPGTFFPTRRPIQHILPNLHRPLQPAPNLRLPITIRYTAPVPLIITSLPTVTHHVIQLASL
ncbi:hypothetical protein PG991_015454 [Apiospora marii]|uniref:Uncharacterized protein n=1 Tax=Apiospora marii TaxID=335849 RepID=A0ABR1R3H9_9PEZI